MRTALLRTSPTPDARQCWLCAYCVAANGCRRALRPAGRGWRPCRICASVCR